jgi:hypothetical protein
MPRPKAGDYTMGRPEPADTLDFDETRRVAAERVKRQAASKPEAAPKPPGLPDPAPTKSKPEKPATAPKPAAVKAIDPVKRPAQAAPEPKPAPATATRRLPTPFELTECIADLKAFRFAAVKTLGWAIRAINENWPIADDEREGHLRDQLVGLADSVRVKVDINDCKRGFILVDTSLSSLCDDVDVILVDLEPGPDQGDWAKAILAVPEPRRTGNAPSKRTTAVQPEPEPAAEVETKDPATTA